VIAATDLLPNQGILENFVHHNPLEVFEDRPFREALEHAHKLESYMSPAERVFTQVHVDPRKRVMEALSDLGSAFLDRGAAKWSSESRSRGFLYWFASLETLGFARWRRHARKAARRLMPMLEACGKDERRSQAIAEMVLRENLEWMGVPKTEWSLAIRAMMLEVRGWAGMFHRMETHPNEVPDETLVRLIDFCSVQSILARSSIEAIARQSSWDIEESEADDSAGHTSWPVSPLASYLASAPKYRKQKHETHHHASAIAYVDQISERREALEIEFENTLIHTIGAKPTPLPAEPPPRPALQLYTCIDDRECSFRRHVEETNPSAIETFGIAGFFGIPIRFQPMDGRGQMILAPENQNPSAVLIESECIEEHEHTVRYNRRRRYLARLQYVWESVSFSPIGSLALSLVSMPLALPRLFMMGLAPSSKQGIIEKVRRLFLQQPHTDFQQLPFAPEQAAQMLARTFNDIGTQRRFAPIVLVLGHGAVSVNNPFAAAYNCGACGGREGGPNARLLARLANDQQVRECLVQNHGIQIPDDTIFIGGTHNTTTDKVEFYDVEHLPEARREQFRDAKRVIEKACGKNALERCRRFLLAENVRTPAAALRHVRLRARDTAEVRPELNHASNAAVVVGRRSLTKGHNLDRRVFLPSYDPYSDDDKGTNLEHVLSPALVVCSGINLEYLFSTIDTDHHGAGTKAPLNIVGNIGVLQGTSGDLRPGLPTQMTEMHVPIRSLFVVDAPIARVEAVLQSRERLRNLVRNEWVRLVVRDPETGQYFRQVNGNYEPLKVHDEIEGEYVPFTHHRIHGMRVAHRESAIYWASLAGMGLSCIGPIALFGLHSMNPYGALIAACATGLSLPVLAFSRRYLHGEFMFGRFASLCVGLLLGFNIVATAPTLTVAIGGWGLFGFASTFLIGAYNDRPTVRNNAIFAFGAYRISDMAMLTAAALTEHNPAALAAADAILISGTPTSPVVAAALLLAALFKSSQFPLTSLFVRSMEGPTPASALGYAGLSAHVGVVLLTSTLPLWYEYDMARLALASIGSFTALYGTLAAKIRADRKGSIANATSATLGLIFTTIALGHPDLALLMSLGHAAFRMTQVLRSPNMIADSQKIRSALGYMPWPTIVPDWLYRLSWTLRRLDMDMNFLHAVQWLSSRIHRPKVWNLTKTQQWLITAGAITVAGAPYTPVSHYLEEWLLDELVDNPILAGTVMCAHFGISVLLVRFLFLKVLSTRRFHAERHVGHPIHNPHPTPTPSPSTPTPQPKSKSKSKSKAKDTDLLK